jgi:hypothetical protein
LVALAVVEAVVQRYYPAFLALQSCMTSLLSRSTPGRRFGEPRVERAILFGSRAKGTHRPGSESIWLSMAPRSISTP